jgi:protease I
MTGIDHSAAEESVLELSGMRIAVLVERDFEDLELWYPLYRLQEAGAQTVVIGMGWPSYKGKHGTEIKPDGIASDFDPRTFDGVIVPGG